MRADILNSLLTQLNSSSPDIEASAIISTDGLIIASMLPAGMDEDRVGAMSAAMLSLGDRTSQELARGSMEQVLVKGNKGYVLMTYAGENAVLTVLIRSSAKLGLVFLDVKRTSDEVAKMIG
jgi:predicted regulator of Ras-like GTPase activity (Roadblock/LC7/MglB family)